ncbi:MAG: hypothetical protein ACRDHW_09230, partial [Ktedonobacteraceae bacterium]
GLLQPGERQNATELARRSRTRFTVRSLGGKLVLVAALMLLLCMLLFVAVSWGLVRAFYERQASSDASTHLSSLSQIYRAQSTQRLQGLTMLASSTEVKNVVQLQPGARTTLTTRLTQDLVRERLTSLALVNAGRMALVQVGENQPDSGQELFNAGLQGRAGSEIVQQEGKWDLELEVPVRTATGQVVGVLFAVQRLDAYFASDLAANGGLRVVLCQGRQLLGSSDDAMTHSLLASGVAFCEVGTEQMSESEGSYLTLCGTARAAAQLPDSPQLTLVDVEPLYDFSSHSQRVWQILLGIGVFVIALGITIYTIITRFFFIRPLRQLQSYVEGLAPYALDSAPPADELRRLTRSLNLLSESLTTRENESHEITKQMSDLLTMGDILLSTLNLEHLLGEIVSRLGPIMYARSTVLHLYGRETSSPWAVAQWTETHPPVATLAINATESIHSNPIEVHIDPAGDATLAMTTKLSAITVPLRRSMNSTASGKRRALRAPRLTPPPPMYAPHRSR